MLPDLAAFITAVCIGIYLLLFCRIILGVVLLCELYRCYAWQSCFFYHIHCMSVKLSSFLCSLQCASRLWYVQCIPIEFCFSFILLIIKPGSCCQYNYAFYGVFCPGQSMISRAICQNSSSNWRCLMLILNLKFFPFGSKRSCCLAS